MRVREACPRRAFLSVRALLFVAAARDGVRANLLRVDLRDAHEKGCGQAQRVFLLRLLECLDTLCASSPLPHRPARRRRRRRRRPR